MRPLKSLQHAPNRHIHVLCLLSPTRQVQIGTHRSITWQDKSSANFNLFTQVFSSLSADRAPGRCGLACDGDDGYEVALREPLAGRARPACAGARR